MGEHASGGRDVDMQLGNARHASGNARHASGGRDNSKWAGDKNKKERAIALGFSLGQVGLELGLGRMKLAWEVQWAKWAVAVCSFAF